MPVQYTGVLAETRAVRTSAGVFDVSHMGILRVTGPAALGAVQYLLSNDAATLDPGDAQYSLLLNDDGGVIDDVIVYREMTPEPQYLVVVNAANAEADLAWIRPRLASGAALTDLSEQWDMLAVQGPEAVSLVESLANTGLDSLRHMSGRRARVAGVSCFVSRTGYTGEDGVEVLCPEEDVEHLFATIIKAGAQPCGLGARDVLRIEAGLPLHGQELSERISPVEAGLKWPVKPAKGAFIGREAYLCAREMGPVRRRAGLRLTGRRIAYGGAVVEAMGQRIGEVTSGTFSPSLGCAIAQAYVRADLAQPDTPVQVETTGGLAKAVVVGLPFIRHGRAVVAV